MLCRMRLIRLWLLRRPYQYYGQKVRSYISYNRYKYTPTFQNYITALVALANTRVSTDAEAIANKNAMMAIYQKIVNYCSRRALSVLLEELLSAVQTIKTRTAGI